MILRVIVHLSSHGALTWTNDFAKVVVKPALDGKRFMWPSKGFSSVRLRTQLCKLTRFQPSS